MAMAVRCLKCTNFQRFRPLWRVGSWACEECLNHVRDVGVAGSNPVTPTKETHRRRLPRSPGAIVETRSPVFARSQTGRRRRLRDPEMRGA